MKESHATLLLLTVILVLAGCQSSSQKQPDCTGARIGTYDSRAVAVAFVGSEVYKNTAGKKMNEMMAEYKKAESEDDKQKLAELKARGEAKQALLHKQGFSTAPVDDILEHISDRLPEIKKQVGVDVLVSKWDAQTLAEHKSAEQVDVTMLLVEVFQPNEKQKRSAIEIQKHDPVSLEKMKGHKH